MANRLTKTAVAASNAQQVNPAHVVQKAKKEVGEFDNNHIAENKIDVTEKKSGISLTLVAPRQQIVTEKVSGASALKEESKEKELQQDIQTLVTHPDKSFATPRSEAELKVSQKNIPQGWLVDDASGSLHEGQMRKTVFIESLRSEITKAIEPVLKAVGQTTKDCSYMNYWLDLYHQKDATHIEQTIKKYAPDSISASSAEEYISIVTQRALRAAIIWANTGRLSGVPPGVPTTIPGEVPGRHSRAVLPKAKHGGARIADPDSIQQQLGEGQPLPSAVRSRMEPAFGTSFQNVRSHTDSNAGSLVGSLNARAFTIGNHVAFGPGEYQPGTILGDALIAHELAHVVQQQGATSSVEKMDTFAADYNALEQDADRTAMNVVSSLWSNESAGARNVMSSLRTGLRLQGCCKQPEIPRKTMKNLTVDFITMRGVNRSTAADLAKANEIFLNASVSFTAKRTEAVPNDLSDKWLGGDTDILATTPASVEERDMFDEATKKYSLSSRMRAFYVESLTGMEALAYSIPPYVATGSRASYVNHAVMTNVALPDTLAHEFGHILLDRRGDHHGIDDQTDTCNLMFAPGRTGSVLDATQAGIIYNNA